MFDLKPDYAGIRAGIGPRLGLRRSNFLNAYAKTSVHVVSGFNCSAIEFTHSRNLPIRHREARIASAPTMKRVIGFSKEVS